MSRIITPPDLMDKTGDYTVVVVDATEEEIAKLKQYLQVCRRDFDVYLYHGTYGDLPYLAEIDQIADNLLIAKNSEVTTTGRFENFGPDTKYPDLLDYFDIIDNQIVDTN